MKSEHALRYLLLKHTWKRKKEVPLGERREVSRSLEVNQLGDNFLISWVRDGKVRQKNISIQEFQFYKRGDIGSIVSAETDAGIASKNDAVARCIVAEIFGVDPQIKEDSGVLALYQQPWLWILMCGIVAFLSLVYAHSLFALVFLMLAGFELVKRSYAPYILLPLVLVIDNFEKTAFIICVFMTFVYGFCAINRREFIWTIIAYSIMAAVVWRVGVPQLLSWMTFTLSIITLILLLASWLTIEGKRLSVLLAPVLASGLIMDGCSLIGVSYFVATFIHCANRLHPKRKSYRENT